MPGPLEPEPTRAVALRAALAFALILTLGALLTAGVLVTGRDDAPAGAAARRAALVAATLRMVPAPGRTGEATCTDPGARQEWRVSWQAVAADTPASSAPPATPATPVTPGPFAAETPRAPGTTVAAPPVTGPSPDLASDLASDLAARTAAVRLVPTGFAVRPLPGATTDPASTAVLSSSGLSSTNGSGTVTSGVDGAVGAAPGASPTPALPGGWQSRDLDRWLLRWSPTLAETVTAVPNEEWVRMGPLSTLAAIAMTVRQDPRFVTPDGACTVYLAPFTAGTAGGDRVAVVGDSLVGQLYASEDGTATGTGPLLTRLDAAGVRAEIAGQGGRRWSIKPDGKSGLEEADATLRDELRGLREAHTVVVALGTNDAGWVALAPNQELYDLRLAWVLIQLAPMLDELRDHGHCTVLATMAQRNKSYIDTAPGRFDAVATRINDYLRMRAATDDPQDRLRLWDWGAHADGHATTDPEPWFGRDTIHLNQFGLAPYADELTAAARLCTG